MILFSVATTLRVYFQSATLKGVTLVFHDMGGITMTRTIGIGGIGMGWMGEVHSRSYRAIPDRFYESGIFARLGDCADPVEARAQAAQQRFGFERYTPDWRAVITDPPVEVSNLGAPNAMHLGS